MKTVTLWHGTTESAAKQIAADGFKPTDTASLVALTAAACGADPAAVVAALRAANRFVQIQDGRDNAAWFASDKERAVRWAQRAPEARWEALWGSGGILTGTTKQCPRHGATRPPHRGMPIAMWLSTIR